MRFSDHDGIKAAFEDPAKRAALVQEASAMMPLWSVLTLRRVNTEKMPTWLGKPLLPSLVNGIAIRWTL